jgi:streptomycin 6-kinase
VTIGRTTEVIEIPDRYAKRARRQFGEKGTRWLEVLPGILEDCRERWELHEIRPVEPFSINLVYFARSSTHGQVVLKAMGPHAERETEIAALELLGGDRACRCLASNPADGVMLLERLVPGTPLRSLDSREDQLSIGAEMLFSLPRELDSAPMGPRADMLFPTYREWLDRAVKQAQSSRQSDEELSLIDATQSLYHELDDGSRYLLHGDLHHDNILKCQPDAWKAIDPQGVIGPRIMESGRFIQNHADSSSGLDLGTAERAAAVIAEALGTTAAQALGAFFVLHLLSTLWGREMSYAARDLRRMFGECTALLSHLEARHTR